MTSPFPSFPPSLSRHVISCNCDVNSKLCLLTDVCVCVLFQLLPYIKISQVACAGGICVILQAQYVTWYHSDQIWAYRYNPYWWL